MTAAIKPRVTTPLDGKGEARDWNTAAVRLLVAADYAAVVEGGGCGG